MCLRVFTTSNFVLFPNTVHWLKLFTLRKVVSPDYAQVILPDSRCLLWPGSFFTLKWNPSQRYVAPAYPVSLGNMSWYGSKLLTKCCFMWTLRSPWHLFRCKMFTDIERLQFSLLSSSGDWWSLLSPSTMVKHVKVWKQALSVILSFEPVPRNSGVRNLLQVLQYMYNVSIRCYLYFL